MSYFIGGHHSYGHNDNWRVVPTWKSSLDSPGAQQMTILKNVFISRRWWELVPDQTIFESDASSGSTPYKALRTRTGDLLMIYSSSPATFSIHMDKMIASGPVTASWINPRNADALVIGTFLAKGVRAFTYPPEWEDSLLIIEATEDRKSVV